MRPFPCWGTFFTVAQTVWHLSHVLSVNLLSFMSRTGCRCRSANSDVLWRLTMGLPLARSVLCVCVATADRSHIPLFVPPFHLLPVCRPQQQVSQWEGHICSRLVSFLKSLYHQQLRVWRQFYDVFNSRRFKQVSKWVLYPIITSYLSQQLRGEMTKLCECLGKARKMAKDVKLNGEHTDGVINTLARLASSPYPSNSCCIQIFLESNFASFSGAFGGFGHLCWLEAEKAR